MTAVTSAGPGTSAPDAAPGGARGGGRAPPSDGSNGGADRDWRRIAAPAFLLPALILLGALVVYPIVFTIWRSLYDNAGDTFVGIDNYRDMFSQDGTRTAIRNNVIWVAVAPAIVTGIGLIYAVLAERVRWETGFKVVVFMPMAISFLAAGVIFRLVYERDPDQGLANAIVTTVADPFRPDGRYLNARPRGEELLRPEGGGFITVDPVATGEPGLLPLVGLPPKDAPDDAEPAAVPELGEDEAGGVVWLDFTRGGGGRQGEIDEGEVGLPGMTVEAVRDGEVAGRATAEADGSFVIEGLDPGEYRLRLPKSNFREAWNGLNWLGRDLVTSATIGSFIWIWAGFAMIVIGAGLAAIPRDVLEAARVDGATEWQLFRRVTAPLLRPVLLVVLVTLMINVLKIFDLVFIIPPGSVQDDASVIALEMWRVSFGGANDQGLGSALSVLLFALVVPAMAFNIRRFRRENT